jgi:hypothetical protein
MTPRMKACGLIVCFVAAVCASPAQDAKAQKQPILRAKSAMRIGKAELVRVYGKGVLSEEPFTATAKDGVWTVTGTGRCQEALPATHHVCTGGHWVRLAGDDGHTIGIGGQGADQ